MIRDARPADVPALLGLIRDLARYEKEPDAVVATAADLEKALFGPDPRVHAIVATDDSGAGEGYGEVIGMAIWFLAYSTWTGRHSLYLEDIFVRPERRRGGTGRALIGALAARAVDLGCARMDWSVLDWNEPAMAFYRTLGAQPMTEWTTWRVEGSDLRRLAAG